MIKYRVSYHHPHRHLIDFEMKIDCESRDEILLQLPSWRPGRYELGNFAKNIREFNVLGEDNKPLKYHKKSKDLWSIQTENQKIVVVNYQFYADVLNGGSTYLDEEQLYINPVNCFFYLPDALEEEYEIQFDVPDDYVIATGLPHIKGRRYKASDHQELFDCPLICSGNIEKLTYEVDGVVYNIWIQGETLIHRKKMIADHKAFTETQVKAFGDIPCTEYHFLYQFPSYRVRHGVEHHNSTVIAMGPGSALHLENQYNELIGISCHELYHTWNIKSIRPKEMMPYDFSKENYSNLGYVAEGVTTYFGDQFLWRSDVFTQEQFFEIVQTSIDRYYQNEGRKNLSVAESSFDTWLDGYVKGIPWRKVSIYNEGMLIALICDLRIIRNTDGKKSLDDVMKIMYDRFGKKEIGYSELDYLNCMEEVGQVSFQDVFNELFHGTEDYGRFLKEELSYFGIKLNLIDNPNPAAGKFGFFTDDKNSVVLVAENSPADQSGLWFGDKIIAIDGIQMTQPVSHYFKEETKNSFELLVSRQGKAMNLTLKRGDKTYFSKSKLEILDLDKSPMIKAWKR